MNTRRSATATVPFNGLIGSLLVALLFIVFRDYQGNSHLFYSDIPQYLSGESTYQRDIYLTGIISKSTFIFYRLLSALHLNIDNNLSGFALYFVFAAAALWSVAKVLKSRFHTASIIETLGILLVTSRASSKLLESVPSGILTDHSGTPTMVAYLLLWPLVFLTLEKKIKTVVILQIFLITIAIKIAWAPILICNVFLILTSRQKISTIIFTSLPLIVGCLEKIGMREKLSFLQRQELCHLIFVRHGAEEIPYLQDSLAILFFTLALIGTPWLLSSLHDQAIKVLYTICAIVSAVIFFGGYAYTRYFVETFPFPEALLLSPSRATSLFAMMFSLLLCHRLVVTRTLSASTKVFFLLAVVVFEAGAIKLQILAGVLCLLAVSVEITHRYMKKSFPASGAVTVHKIWYVMSFSIVVFFMRPALRPHFNTSAFNLFSRWTVRSTDLDELATLKELRSEETDLILGVFTRRRPERRDNFPWQTISPPAEGDIWLDATNNVLAGKSKLLGDPGALFLEPDRYSQHAQREAVVGEILRCLNEAVPINTRTEKFLSENKVALIVPHLNSCPQLQRTTDNAHTSVDLF